MKGLPEGSCEHLLDFLRMYRDAVQLVVNELWSLNEKLSKKKLHEAFYDKLRRLGLRAHHVKQIYTYALSVVMSAKANGGKKPVLRKLNSESGQVRLQTRFRQHGFDAEAPQQL